MHAIVNQFPSLNSVNVLLKFLHFFFLFVLRISRMTNGLPFPLELTTFLQTMYSISQPVRSKRMRNEVKQPPPPTEHNSHSGASDICRTPNPLLQISCHPFSRKIENTTQSIKSPHLSVPSLLQFRRHPPPSHND